MKRQLSGAVAALAVLASGALASACDLGAPAATANGVTISTATLNNQLRALEGTVAGGCLLQLENPQLSTSAAQGAGGSGTYSMSFATQVLQSQVGDLLAQQYAASKGITVSPSDLATANSDFASTLSGEISSAAQQSASTGVPSYCQNPDGSTLTGAELLARLPADIRAAQVRNQAVDEKLLARGSDLSDAAVLRYYGANQAQFTVDCVSVIATDSKAHADQLVAQLEAGASFASVAKASSLDSANAANGGSLGCRYTQAGVEQALQVQAITVGQPIAPIQDPSSGQWVIYEVTSRSVEPLSAAASVIRRELLQSSSNVQRVSREIVAFAHRSDVSVDPRYGTWERLNIVPPVAPPPQYLLGAVSGSPTISTSSPLDLGGAGAGASSGTSGTGTAGSSSSSTPTTTAPTTTSGG